LAHVEERDADNGEDEIDLVHELGAAECEVRAGTGVEYDEATVGVGVLRASLATNGSYELRQTPAQTGGALPPRSREGHLAATLFIHGSVRMDAELRQYLGAVPRALGSTAPDALGGKRGGSSSARLSSTASSLALRSSCILRICPAEGPKRSGSIRTSAGRVCASECHRVPSRAESSPVARWWRSANEYGAQRQKRVGR
jgi:hypothetical protein